MRGPTPSSMLIAVKAALLRGWLSLLNIAPTKLIADENYNVVEIQRRYFGFISIINGRINILWDQ